MASLWSFLDSAVKLSILKALELTQGEEHKAGTAGFLPPLTCEVVGTAAAAGLSLTDEEVRL